MRRLSVIIALLLPLACERKLEGPAPTVNGVQPAAACNAQLTTTVTVGGEGLSPLVTSALDDKQLELPKLELLRTVSLAGESTPLEVVLPDDPKDPAASQVRWFSQEQMTFAVAPALNLEPGLYDLRVSNANGGQAIFEGALLSVPPPTLRAAVPDIACDDKTTTIQLSGDYFLSVGQEQPRIHIGTQQFAPTSTADCRELPGRAGFTACRTLQLTIEKDAFTAGVYDVKVTNPAPVECSSSETVKMTFVPPPTLTAVQPDLVCTADGENTLTATGTDFIVIDGVAPTLQFAGTAALSLPTVASNCEPVEGPLQAVQRCTSLTATLAQNGLVEGSYTVAALNPAPADCQSGVVGFVVAPKPTVTAVIPEVACTAQGTISVELQGTGFLTIDGEAPSVQIAGASVSSTASDCTPLTGSTSTAQTCTTLTVTVAQNSAVGSAEVIVTNPAPAGCVSEPGPFFTIIDRPTVTSIEPLSLCTAAGDVSFLVTGTGFIAVSETDGNGTVTRTGPSVAIGSTFTTTTAATGGCAAVPNTTGTESCTTLAFSVPGGTFTTPGVEDVVVANPAGVGCSSATGSAPLAVMPPPTIEALSPSNICASGDSVRLFGTNFAAGSTVTLQNVDGGSSVIAQSVTLSADGGIADALFASGVATGTYSVNLEGGGCGTVAPTPLTVIPGPQVFFTDPSTVFSGITTQATVYGTGFTLPIMGVSISLSDGGMLPDGGTSEPLIVTDSSRPNQVQVLIPKDLPAGSYDLLLDDNTTCSAILDDALTVTSQTTLALGPVEPPFGAEGESTGVSISSPLDAGTGFIELPRVYLNPSTPTATTVATNVGAVSFVGPDQLTALVPGALPAGSYDLIVVNPDGTVGYRADAFTVTAAATPPPVISGLSPGSLPNTGTPSTSVQGANFRTGADVTLRTCVDANGAPTTAPTATITSTSFPSSITVAISNIGSAVACVVRVTNTDNNTYGDFSALVFTNPSKNLYPAIAGPPLTVARRAPATVGADATTAARFVHVIGGDDGTGAAFDTIESAVLDPVGVPLSWFTQRNTLSTPRAFAGAVSIGRFIYVVGGSNAGAQLATVERASVLDPERRTEVTELLLDLDFTGAGLDSGLYYYRVAAVMDPSFSFNPGGEELASDPFPVRLPVIARGKLTVKLTWTAVPGAVGYRVYRTPMANDPVSAARVIADVTCAASPCTPPVTFTDTGVAPSTTNLNSPLPIGSIGVWSVFATLSTPREGAGVAWARDPLAPTSAAYIYAIGGRSNATTALTSYEYVPLTFGAGGDQTLAAVGVQSGGTNTLGTARWQLSSTTATAAQSQRVSGNASYVYALSGVSAAGAVAGVAEAAEVTAGGLLSPFVALPNLNRAGYASVFAADQVFAFGGNQASPESSISNGELCGAGNTAGACAQPGKATPPYVSNWNTGQNMLQSRYLMGGALHGAFIYIAAGVGSANTPLASTEYRIW